MKYSQKILVISLGLLASSGVLYASQQPQPQQKQLIPNPGPYIEQSLINSSLHGRIRELTQRAIIIKKSTNPAADLFNPKKLGNMFSLAHGATNIFTVAQNIPTAWYDLVTNATGIVNQQFSNDTFLMKVSEECLRKAEKLKSYIGETRKVAAGTSSLWHESSYPADFDIRSAQWIDSRLKDLVDQRDALMEKIRSITAGEGYFLTKERRIDAQHKAIKSAIHIQLTIALTKLYKELKEGFDNAQRRIIISHSQKEKELGR